MFGTHPNKEIIAPRLRDCICIPSVLTAELPTTARNGPNSDRSTGEQINKIHMHTEDRCSVLTRREVLQLVTYDAFANSYRKKTLFSCEI